MPSFSSSKKQQPNAEVSRYEPVGNLAPLLALAMVGSMKGLFLLAIALAITGVAWLLTESLWVIWLALCCGQAIGLTTVFVFDLTERKGPG